MHDDVGPEHVRDVVDRLAELVGRVVVDEPVGRARRHVVDDLAHELAVARAVAVVVAAREPVGLVEGQPVLAVGRRQLAAGERIEPAGGSEGLVEDDDRDAAAVVARALQRVGAAQRDALRDDAVGRGRLGGFDLRDRGGSAQRRERSRPERGLEPPADPALGDAAGSGDRALRCRAAPAGVTNAACATGAPDVRSRAALAMVHHVRRAANAHGSATFVPIDASLADLDAAIGGTVAKRTIHAGGPRAAGARVCRIPLVPSAEEQR